jgi:hypothetical protein
MIKVKLMILLMFLPLTGCITLDDIRNGDFSNITDYKSKPAEFNKEEHIEGVARIMSIDVDSKNQPHIIADQGGSPLSHFYDRIKGKWYASSFDCGGTQAYNPHIEINKKNQAWYSVVKWHPDGMGLMIREDINEKNQPVLKYVPTTGGMGNGKLPCSNLSIEYSRNNTVIVYGGNGGHWQRYEWDGANLNGLESGGIGVNRGGEKNFFDISRADENVWHGCTELSYNNSVRSNHGKRAIDWGDKDTYWGWAGHDEVYPVVVADYVEPQTAYMLIDYKSFGGPGIMMNIWKGDNDQGDGHFVFPVNDLLNIDSRGMSGMKRYEPQACPALNGGIYVCYNHGNHIIIAYIPSDIQIWANIIQVAKFDGTRGTICCDHKGNIHVVYLKGGIKYRRLEGIQ